MKEIPKLCLTIALKTVTYSCFENHDWRWKLFDWYSDSIPENRNWQKCWILWL